MQQNIYDFTVDNIQGNQVELKDFQGKVILIVNTASKCGFTPQYKGLEELYQKYKDRGFIILGFPCNQFGNQEPGDEKSIVEGCLLNYGVSFPMFSKIKVNGKDSHPLYEYLKSHHSGILNSSIKWNFTKFLINKKGIPFKRYSSLVTPKKLEQDIESLLNE